MGIKIIGVMGGANAGEKFLKDAERLGRMIAERGWILLNGGRNKGVMEASARGANLAGGITLGILPDKDKNRMSKYISIPVITGLGDARNVINVLSSDIIIACPGGAGTISEISLALKSSTPVILFNFDSFDFFKKICSESELYLEKTPEAVLDRIEKIFAKH